jgi:hypothetical protein
MKLSGILLLLSALTLLAFRLPPAGSEAYMSYFFWNENRKLNWDDFEGKPVANASEVAMTASSVEFSYKTKKNELNWTVNSKFYPKLSWSIKNKQSDYILQHEQLHFDITELYARLMRKRLTEEIKSAKDYQKLNVIGKDVLKKWQTEQNTYDRETRHSVDSVSQKRWNELIQKRLDELKAYSSN